ncbi:6-phosphogluconolactonase [Paenibacillus forsythiae]|uniref:6-phosphogluconolactonase n=1 Tax=Paenibacillus forsythiae TaxID=365616 RepID=A0ABU3H464_9BACL|nr:lactonase family protein [Paenibacillus forsythiae]MDT3425606.1 6-phosphogluconolactonase [Paenibacillus forsythiae]
MTESSKLLLFTGAYSGAGEKGIHVFQFDPSQGALTLLDEVKGIANPTFVDVDAGGRRLYAIGDKLNEDGVKEGEVAAYSIDSASGALKEISRTGTMPAEGKTATSTCHIISDASNRYLIVSSYHGGMIGLVALDGEGRTVRLTDSAVHTGHGADPERQDRPHPHSATLSPDGRFLFVCDLGLDVIRKYTVNYEKETLEAQGDTRLHPGAGPRHFAFHPDGHSAYVINEVDSTITSFTYEAESGTLKTVATVQALPADYALENTCAEIALSPDGRYLYGSNRGHDSIVVYAVNPATAELAYVEHVSTRGGHPRHFALTPDGSYLIVANRDANNLVVFARDNESGRLTFTGHEAAVSKPVCVKPALF